MYEVSYLPSLAKFPEEKRKPCQGSKAPMERVPLSTIIHVCAGVGVEGFLEKLKLQTDLGCRIIDSTERLAILQKHNPRTITKERKSFITKHLSQFRPHNQALKSKVSPRRRSSPKRAVRHSCRSCSLIQPRSSCRASSSVLIFFVSTLFQS
jgi:hypothetical protein